MNVNYDLAVSLIRKNLLDEAAILLIEWRESVDCPLSIHDLFTFLMQKQNKLDLAYSSALYVLSKDSSRSLHFFRAAEIAFRKNLHDEAVFFALQSFECKHINDDSPDLIRIVNLVQQCLRVCIKSPLFVVYKSIFKRLLHGINPKVLISEIIPIISIDLVDLVDLVDSARDQIDFEVEISEELLFKFLSNEWSQDRHFLVSRYPYKFNLELFSLRAQFLYLMMVNDIESFDGESAFLHSVITDEIQRSDLLFKDWTRNSLKWLNDKLLNWNPKEQTLCDFRSYLRGLVLLYLDYRFDSYELLKSISSEALLIRSAICIIELEILSFKDPQLALASMRRFNIEVEQLGGAARSLLNELLQYVYPNSLTFKPTLIKSNFPTAKNTCIFIKTYPADYRWLSYLLKSIDRFVVGYSEIIIVTDDSEANFPINLNEICEKINAKVHFTSIPEWCQITRKPGYWWQQVCKLEYYKWVDSEYAFFVDSDCFFESHFDLQNARFKDGKPVILRRKWAGSGQVWRSAIRYLFGDPGMWSYMRRNGLIMSRDVLIEFSRYLHENFNLSIDQFMLEPINAMPKSEFEIFGYFSDRYFSNCFQFVEAVDKDSLVQFRSWDGLDSEVEERMKLALNLR